MSRREGPKGLEEAGVMQLQDDATAPLNIALSISRNSMGGLKSQCKSHSGNMGLKLRNYI